MQTALASWIETWSRFGDGGPVLALVSEPAPAHFEMGEPPVGYCSAWYSEFASTRSIRSPASARDAWSSS